MTYRQKLLKRGDRMANPVVIAGSGPKTVVALHGWFGSARGWGSLPDYLDGRSYTYAFMDMRGHGQARDLEGIYSAEEVAGDVLVLADELGWKQFSLIGHSMGAMFVQKVLAKAPERVHRIVGINPVPATGVPFDEPSWDLFSGAATRPENRAAIIDHTTGNRLTKTFIDMIVQHSLEHSRVDAFSSYLQSWAKTDFSEEVKGMETEVKVIVGQEDPAMTAEVMKETWMRFYPNAQLETFANAGHYPMYETPVALASSIERFLS